MAEYTVSYSPTMFGGDGLYTVVKVDSKGILRLRRFKTQRKAQVYADSLNA